MAQWGHDFRPDYLELSALHERWPDVPRIALTATATQATRTEIAARLNLDSARHFVASFDRPNIRYRIEPKAEPSRQLLTLLRTEHDGDAGIVYCLSRASVEKTAEFLTSNGIAALPYHAGLDSSMTDGQPGPVPARGRPGDGRHDRVRHGHRQAGRAFRRPPGPAQVGRGLLPGDRPGRPRRAARHCLAGLRPAGRGAAAQDDRRTPRATTRTGASRPATWTPCWRSARPSSAAAPSCWATSARTPPRAATATPAWSRRRPGTAPSPRRSCCPRSSG